MEESVPSRGSPPPQPWASDSPSPTPLLQAHCLGQHLSAESTALRTQEGRGRDRGREKRGPLCPPWLLCSPRARTATPTPILAQLGGGGGRRRGSCGTPHPASDPGPSPSTATPPCPGGLRPGSQTAQGQGGPSLEEEDPGVEGEWGPTGRIKRCQAGGQRTGSRGVGDRGSRTASWMLGPQPSVHPGRLLSGRF